MRRQGTEPFVVALRSLYGGGAKERRHPAAMGDQPGNRDAYSSTSSARARSVGGTSRPSVLAVFRLMSSSYLFGFCTGRSAGFSPLRMRSTYPAACRYSSIGLVAMIGRDHPEG